MSVTDDRVDRIDRIRRRFREFGAEYASLPLYGALSPRIAEDVEVASLLTAAQPGQARPVLWFAALHDLVLRRPDLPAARWYASVVGRDGLRDGDPWPDVRATVLEHADEMRKLIATRTVQTNEVNRAVYVAAGIAAAARTAPQGLPVALVELGASSGLLLGVDRYAVRAGAGDGEVLVGDPSSSVRCWGEDRSTGRPALRPLPEVVARVGLDRDPVRLDDGDAVRWLLACLWPDVPGRVERFRAARSLLRTDPPLLVQGDLVDDVGTAVGAAVDAAGRAAAPDVHVVVLTSWALTYVDRARRDDLVARLDGLSRGVPALTWFSAEPPGCVPGLPDDPRCGDASTVFGLRHWADGSERPPRVVGRGHPHGAWLETW